MCHFVVISIRVVAAFLDRIVYLQETVSHSVAARKL